jgi:hypothetical protein
MASDSDKKEKPVLRYARELRAVNADIRRLLQRLPLNDHREVSRLNTLLNQQEQLVRTPTRGGSVAETVLLDNEKHSARFLRMRYREAEKNEKLRSPKLNGHEE